MKHRIRILAAVLALMICAAPTAKAWEIETPSVDASMSTHSIWTGWTRCSAYNPGQCPQITAVICTVQN